MLHADDTVMLFDDLDALEQWYDSGRKGEATVEYEQNTTIPIAEVVTLDDNESNGDIVSLPQVETNTTIESKENIVLTDIIEETSSDTNYTTKPKVAKDVKSIVIAKYYEDGDSVTQEFCNSAGKDYIDFWNLLDQALINATAVILKKHDIKITEENMDIIRSEYYPNLSMGYAGEYYHGFSRTSKTGVGGTFYPATSDFRDSLDLSINHELYRFGATDLKVKMGKKDVEIVKSELALQAEDVSKKLLEYYTAALRAQNIISYKEKIRLVQDRILQKKWRLYESGQITKIVISKDRLSMITVEKEISQQKITLLKAIKNIEMLANVRIDTFRSKFAMLEPKNSKIKTFEESAMAKHLKLQMEKKVQELELVKKDYLPAVYASGQYLLLGSDQAMFKSISDLEKNSWNVGLNVKWDIFNGYKTDETVDKTKAEIQKLAEKYRQAKLEFEAKAQQRELMEKSIDKVLKIESEMYDQTCQQAEMLTKLEGVGLVDAIQLDQIEISKIRSELEFRLGVLDKVYQTISGELIQ